MWGLTNRRADIKFENEGKGKIIKNYQKSG